VLHFIVAFLKEEDDVVSSLLAPCSWKKEMSWQRWQLLEALQTCLYTSSLPNSYGFQSSMARTLKKLSF